MINLNETGYQKKNYLKLWISLKKYKKKEAISKNIAVKLSKCLRINVYILIPSQTFKKESSNIKCLKIKNKKLKKSLMSN